MNRRSEFVINDKHLRNALNRNRRIAFNESAVFVKKYRPNHKDSSFFNVVTVV